MNFQEAFWFSREQQQYQQSINLVDPTIRIKPKSIMNNNNNNSPHSLSFSHQDDIDNDQFPDQDDQQSTTTTINNTTRTTQDYYTIIDREPMFEKPLTPSDVGKLNRLVIPKQHAEKYFPLNGGNTTGGGSESTGEKGLVLCFEDELGKGWRFRYSYWNSSQSYVLTKGWSRFVKEKKLDAGDVVLFDRHKVDLDRFFIGWRKRGVGGRSSTNSAMVVQGGDVIMAAPSTSRCGGGGGWSTNSMYNYNALPNYHQQAGYSSLREHSVPGSTYQPRLQVGGAGGGDYLHLRTVTGVEHEKAPAAAAITSGNKKKSSMRRLRLFGVNLECHEEDVDCSAEPDQTSDGSSLSSGGGTRGTGSAGNNNTNIPAAAPSNYYYFNNNNNYFDYLGYPR